MLRMPRAVTEGVRMCAGRDGPIRIGPTEARRQDLDHLIGDVGGIEVRHDQDVGDTLQLRMRQDQFSRGLGKRGIALHLAVGSISGWFCFKSAVARRILREESVS